MKGLRAFSIVSALLAVAPEANAQSTAGSCGEYLVTYDSELGTISHECGVPLKDHKDAVADQLTNVEYLMPIDFFTGPTPAEFSGLLSVWEPRRAFRPGPFSGPFDLDPGSVEKGVDDFCELVTVNSTFLAGRNGLRLSTTLNCRVVPEPHSTMMLGLVLVLFLRR